ncbi:MAG: DUF3037 domain-containing protein [Candidatus Acidiferrales bacterium]
MAGTAGNGPSVGGPAGSGEPGTTLRYRILRYVPNLVRDEWVNVGVLLEEARGSRRAVRLIEQPGEFARVRRLHPDADEDYLRALAPDFDARLRGPEAEVAAYLQKLEQNLSNVLQLSAPRGLLADNFDAELDRLYREQVTPPGRRGGGILQNTRDWMREKLNDVFRRHRILGKLEHRVRVEGFTQPGDPLRLDYGYQNGVRGFIHSVSLRRDLPQAKALAYTAECIHARDALAEITAITEAAPDPENPRQLFVERLFSEKSIRIVPMSQVEGFAEELRLRIQ